jgi:hypothetical protein
MGFLTTLRHFTELSSGDRPAHGGSILLLLQLWRPAGSTITDDKP